MNSTIQTQRRHDRHRRFASTEVNKVAPAEPFAFGVTRLLEEIGVILRGYLDRCRRATFATGRRRSE